MDLNLYLQNIGTNSESNQTISRSFYDKYLAFDYDNHDLFKIDVDCLLNIYDIELNDIELNDISRSPTDERLIDLHLPTTNDGTIEVIPRMSQSQFRDALINKYKHCIITENSFEECEACHIVPHSEEINYDINNGLLLNRSLHKLFDDYFWTIHPETMCVIISDKARNKKLSCNQYENLFINIEVNETLKNNLHKRYRKFVYSI